MQMKEAIAGAGQRNDILGGIKTNIDTIMFPAPHISFPPTHHNTMMMDGNRKSAWLLLLLSIVQMVTAASGRPFSSSHGSQAQTPHPSQGRWAAKEENLGGRIAMEGDDGLYGINRLGSRPPGCQAKCGECKPCVAVQVPIPKNKGVQQQYTNYQPEGWKCKCGSVFFNP